ncbi:MAG: hypothetical protein ACFFAX_03190 [Promethearchaeota archaeon]
MKKRLVRLIGKGLAIIGTPVFLLFGYGTYTLLSYTGEYGPLPREAALVPLIALLGLSMIAAGVDLLQRFEEPVPLLVKDGGPTHMGEIRKEGTEVGLYLTSCGRVVSINQESSSTAHVGYKVAFEGQVTCRDCATSEGRVVLESYAHGRKGY